MTKKEELVWRLGKLPSVEELRELVKDKIITNEEAREILFKKESQDEQDNSKEIEFLRELVKTLSRELKNSRGAVTTVYYPQRYEVYPWIGQYHYNTGKYGGDVVLCNAVGSTFSISN